MTIQLIEDEVVFEVTVREDASTTHLMAPDANQWVKINTWFGNMKMVHQIIESIYQTITPESSTDAIIGRVVTAIASSPELLTKLPSSAIGNKINELNQWISEGHSELGDVDDQRIVISGSDFEVKQDGTVWVTGLGSLPFALSAEQMVRVPVSVEFLADPLYDLDSVGVVVNYRDETSQERHLTLV